MADLRWLRESGMEAADAQGARGRHAGFRHLRRLSDDGAHGVRPGQYRGRRQSARHRACCRSTRCSARAKTTTQTRGTVADTDGRAVTACADLRSRAMRSTWARPCATRTRKAARSIADAWRRRNTRTAVVTENACGTYLHGVFDAPEAAQRTCAGTGANQKGVTLERRGGRSGTSTGSGSMTCSRLPCGAVARYAADLPTLWREKHENQRTWFICTAAAAREKPRRPSALTVRRAGHGGNKVVFAQFLKDGTHRASAACSRNCPA